MADNYIVLRRSPDWPTFDLNETRAFCNAAGVREDLVIGFAAAWDSVLGLDYRSYRQRQKEISLRTAYACLDAIVVDHARFDPESCRDDDLIYFTDDDDWVSPSLFQTLRREALQADLVLWGSIFVGKLTAATPYETPASPVVSRRKFSRVVYTNNYAVTGSTLKRLGYDALLEHYQAQRTVDLEQVTTTLVERHLTAANKHPCCTVCIEYNTRSLQLPSGLPGYLAGFVEDLTAARDAEHERWLRDCLDGLIAVTRDALG